MKKRKIQLMHMILVIVAAMIIIPETGAAQYDWPMFHHDLNHTGYTASTAPDTNDVLWSFTTGSIVHSSPAVADGRVYLGSYDSKVYCLDNLTGAMIWSHTTGDGIVSSPAVADGKVYVGSNDDKLYCLNASTGDTIWTYTTTGNVESSPAVSDGKVYVGSSNGKFYCLDASNGDLIWRYTTGDMVKSSPAVADGKVYVGSWDNKLYCFNASTGDTVWTYNTMCDWGIRSSPAVAYGNVYVGTTDTRGWERRLYCLDASTGAYVWSRENPGNGHIECSPAVADGKVYVGTCNASISKLICYNAYTGAELWYYDEFGDIVVSSPAVADGKVFVGSYDNKVYCVDALTGDLIWSYATGGNVHSSPAIADGKLYIGEGLPGNKVYAFGQPPPICDVSPTIIEFDTVTIGSYKDSTFVITNTGGGGLSGIISESCDHFSIFSGGGSYRLGAGEFQVVTVRFQPALEGTLLCTIETGIELCSDVSCIGVGEEPPACGISLTTLDFGNVAKGSYKDSSFTITNTGGEILTGDVSELCDHYSIVSGGGSFSLGADESHIVTVRFEPDLMGAHECTVETGDTLCSDVSCTGVGVTPCVVSPPTIDFGEVFVNDYLDTTFTIKNAETIGDDTLSGSVTESCYHYSIVSGEGPYNLAPGESLIVAVRFWPNWMGVHYCTIETGDTFCCDVNCSGVGVTPCAVSPEYLEFDPIMVGGSKDTTFTIKNIGYGIISGTVSESCDQFSFVPPGDIPYYLDSGESLIVVVRFEPTSTGAFECVIETGDTLCCDVYCMGSTPCDVAPTSIDFGTVLTGSTKDTTFTIVNTGYEILSGTVSESCDQFDFVPSGDIPYYLYSGESLNVTVRFEPLYAGTLTCMIETGDSVCSDVFCMGISNIEPSPVLSTVDPWDTYSRAFVCPGISDPYQNTDSVIVTVLDGLGDPCPYALVEIDLSDCSNLCIDSPDGLSKITDENGIAYLDPRVGGCEDCDVVIKASGIVIRSYSKIKSADWDGSWADGVVDGADSLYLYSQFGTSDACADYDGNGNVGLEDLVTFSECYGSSNTETCSYTCEVVPAFIDYDTVTVGSTKDTTFAIRNTGTKILNGSVSESYDACSCYSIVNGGGPYSIPGGDSLVVTVRFEPDTVGWFLFVVETGDPVCSDFTWNGVGKEAPPECEVTRDTLNFGAVMIGSWMDTTFAIKNTGGGALSGSVSESCDHYSIVSGEGPYSIPGGDSLEVTVRFEPADTGMHVCTIETGDALCSDVFCLGAGIDLTPPLPPTGFSVAYNTGAGNQLSWRFSEAEDFDHFDIYRSDNPDLLLPQPVDTTWGVVYSTSDTSWVDTDSEGWRFRYQITALDHAGNESGPTSPESVTGQDVPVSPSVAFALYQNIPNPFNPVTMIRFDIPRRTRVQLAIYNVRGQLVRLLLDRPVEAGRRQVRWDGKDNRGFAVASGVYFYNLVTPEFSESKKMILLR